MVDLGVSRYEAKSEFYNNTPLLVAPPLKYKNDLPVPATSPFARDMDASVSELS
ncbi:hypothetical protein GCM10023165_20370 [Variovorax defluvii]|uniref:Uncharacterized protein n=1 Tax=Variovorax defluvii TaxID=913761 RepID=A0ABP8HL41_9BURK